jgi:tRNA A37 N6-isopentenylltransferase MiaA
MFDAGVEEEVRKALVSEPSATARKIIGLHEVATLPREDAIEALIVRTRRYAAYQRKWLRRLEGLVIVAADRPPEETATEIVALACTRERLPGP